MKAMDEKEIIIELKKFPAWQRNGRNIERTFEFKDFLAAIAFVNKLATAAEEANHHPDILILYNRVKLSMHTHDAGGLSKRDFDLALAADGLAP